MLHLGWHLFLNSYSLPCQPRPSHHALLCPPHLILPAETLAETVGTHQLSPTAYYVLTYVSLLLIYLLALFISSAYQVGDRGAVRSAEQTAWTG